MDIYEDLEPPLKSTPDDVRVEEGYFKSKDDLDLFFRSWSSDDDPKAIVALQHGYAEHTGRYHHVASALVRHGFAVFGIDARGHGKSQGERGHVDAWDDYVDDFDRTISEAKERLGDLPIVVLGHSNGGLIALRHALNYPGRAVTYVVTSPYCGLAIDVPFVKAFGAKILSKVAPSLSMASGLPPESVSQDPRIVRDYIDDPLVFPTTTPRNFVESQWAQADLMNRAAEIEAPFFFLVAGDDQLVDGGAAEKVYHLIGGSDRELELFPDLYHEILNEEGWPALVEMIVTWMDRHLEAA